MELIIFIVLVIQAIAFAFFTQILATAKGYPSTAYFWIGLFLAVGLLFVMGLPTVATPKPAGEVAARQETHYPATAITAAFVSLRTGWQEHRQASGPNDRNPRCCVSASSRCKTTISITRPER